jgi:hypothetical protein
MAMPNACISDSTSEDGGWLLPHRDRPLKVVGGLNG